MILKKIKKKIFKRLIKILKVEKIYLNVLLKIIELKFII